MIGKFVNFCLCLGLLKKGFKEIIKQLKRIKERREQKKGISRKICSKALYLIKCL